jgi:dienelactone hydrolase
MHTENIEYDIAGVQYIGHLAVDLDRPGRRPGVLVCHEGPGLSDHAKRVAERLAGLGYVAFALDYHGGGVPLPREEMATRFGELMSAPDVMRLRSRTGLDILLGQPNTDPGKVAAIGYCFGGTMALELGRAGADVHVIVGFHSGLATSRPEDAANITGKVLVQIGTEDPIIPPQQRADFEAEMRGGGVDWRMHLYGGAEHSFTNPDASSYGMPGIAYDELTDKRSWRAMIDLFDETFGPI